MLRSTLFASVASIAALSALLLAPSPAHAQYAPGQYGAPPGQYGPGPYSPPGQYPPPGQYGPPGQYAPPPYHPPQYGPAPYGSPYGQPQYGQYPQQPPYQAPPSPPWGQLGITAHFSFVRDLTTKEDGYGFGAGVRTWAFDFPLDIGAELEADRYENDRNDYRANVDLYATMWKKSFFNPYLVVPVGLNVITTPTAGASLQGTIGGGLGFQIKIWRIAAGIEGRAFYRRGQDTSPWATETVAEVRANLMVLPFNL